MSKIVWLSDLHFSSIGPVQGYCTATRVDAAVQFVLDHHADASVCVITGDLVDRGTAADYEALKTHLEPLPMLVCPMVGNHDNRADLRATLPLPQSAMTDFVQYRVDLEDAVLLCLDTQKTGADSGEFCANRTAWLKTELAASDGPILVFIHHPPMALGLPMQDRDCMAGGDAFLDIVQPYHDRVHLCAGHVHRPISGTYRGIGFTTARSVIYQAPNPQPAWDWSSFRPAHEAPSLGVIEVTKQGVIVQQQQFCDASMGLNT